MTLKQEMIQDAHSYNKHLSAEHLNNMSIMDLLRNTHPSYRGEYAYKLKLNRTLTPEEASQFQRLR